LRRIACSAAAIVEQERELLHGVTRTYALPFVSSNFAGFRKTTRRRTRRARRPQLRRALFGSAAAAIC
jgi:hypothetical protein